MPVPLQHRVIEKFERVGTSKSGNPRYRATLADGVTLLTKVDAAFAYAITEHGEFTNTPVTIDIDRYGHIVYIEKEEVPADA